MNDSEKISAELLDMLCCPVGRSALTQRDGFLICESCGLQFPICDGIVSLVADKAILPDGTLSLEGLQCGGSKIKNDHLG